MKKVYGVALTIAHTRSKVVDSTQRGATCYNVVIVNHIRTKGHLIKVALFVMNG